MLVDTRLGPIHVHEHGSGTPVLAVHGVLVDGRLWDATAAALTGTGVRLLAPDLPLGAHSRAVPDRALLTPADVADALTDVLAGLGIAQAVVIGNDTGGAIAQLLAVRHPARVSALALVGCDAFEHFPPPLVRPLVMALRHRLSARLTLRLLSRPALLADPGPLNLLSVRGLGRDLVADLMAADGRDAAVLDDLVAFARAIRPEALDGTREGLAAWRGRAAVVWGRRDRVFPHADARALAALFGTEVVWLDDAATFVPVDRPDAVAAAVLRLIQAGDRAA